MKPNNKSFLEFPEDQSTSTLSLLSTSDENMNIDVPTFTKSSLNVSINLILESFPNIVSLYFLGKYSTVEIQSTFGIVLVFGIVLGYGIFEGLAAGLESFLTSMQSNISTVIYQRTLVISTFVMVPIVLILWITQALVFPFIFLEMASTAGYMLLASSISIYFNGLYMVSRSYMNARQSFKNQLISTLLSSIVHIISCYFFFHYCQFTIFGAILAKIVSDVFNLNFFFKLINISNEIKLQVFQSIKKSQLIPLTKKLFSRGLILSLEFIAYEIFTIQATSLAFDEISTHVIAANVHSFGYFVYIGISVVTYLNVSKYLLNNKKTSLKYAKYGAGLLIGAAVLSLLFLMFAPWRSIFTSDEKVEQDLLSLTPFLIVFMILDCVQAFISSISRAVGQHSSAFKHFIISFFLIGQPLCFFLKSFVPQQGLLNIWLSMIMCVLVYNLWQGNLLLNIDLKEAARKIQEQQDQQQSERQSFIQVYYPQYSRGHSTKSHNARQMQPIRVSRTYSI